MPRPDLFAAALAIAAAAFAPDTLAQPDPLFGVAGYQVVDFAQTSPEDQAYAVATLADGRVIAAGTISVPDPAFVLPRHGIGITRLLPNGAPDPSFGGDGRVEIPGAQVEPDGMLSGYAMAVQRDGKIVVAGTYGGPSTLSNDFAIVRVRADGSGLDTTFSGDGIAIVPFDRGGGNIDVASSVAIQPDGRIVAAGGARSAAGDSDMAVIRLLANGSLDTSFSLDGKMTVSFNLGLDNHDSASALALQSDGKMVLAGSASTTSEGRDSVVARLNANGSPDAGFGNLGGGRSRVGYYAGKHDQARAVAVSELALNPQGSRRIVIAGDTDLAFGGGDFALAVFTDNGQLDPAFSADGKRTLAFNLSGSTLDVANALVIETGWKTVGQFVLQYRKIVVGGTAHSEHPIPHEKFALARLDFGGVLDASFGSGGQVYFSGDFDGDGTPNPIWMEALARQGDAVIAAGTTSMRRGDGTQDTDFVLSRVVLGE